MKISTFLLLSVLAFGGSFSPRSMACCPAGGAGRPVVNADQSVLMIWDPVARRQHFIRKASFKAEGDDFGFLVPTPTQPELSESGNEAFQILAQITAPPAPSGFSFPIGCGKAPAVANSYGVRVLEEKVVAGLHATVLETDSAAALTGWLGSHGYSFSPAVEAWARPYVEKHWKITAMKVVKKKEGALYSEVAATSLRMSFQTDRPLFPYREPDSAEAARALNATSRLLQIYFISDQRYEGALEAGEKWSGQTTWSGPLTSIQRSRLLDKLGLPGTTGPATWHLTEFVDKWQYEKAAGDLFFHPSVNQSRVTRGEPGSQGPGLWIALAGVALVWGLRRKFQAPR